MTSGVVFSLPFQALSTMAGGITETGEPYSAYVSAMLSVDVVSTSVSG